MSSVDNVFGAIHSLLLLSCAWFAQPLPNLGEFRPLRDLLFSAVHRTIGASSAMCGKFIAIIML